MRLDGRRRPVFRSHFWRRPVNHRVFILNFDSHVEVDDLQAKIVVTDQVVGLDVSISYFVLVKICEPLDEAPAETGATATVHKPLVDGVQLR